MGKASRKKKERNSLKPSEKKILRDLLRESSPEVFGNDKGQITYYNPLKRILKAKNYKSDEGNEITKEMMRKYNQFLKKKLEEKANVVKTKERNSEEKAAEQTNQESN